MNYSRTTTAHSQVAELVGFVDTGIEHCRAGRWDKGVEYLSYVATRESTGLKEAGLFLSYLGCGMARRGRHEQGLALCRRAVEVEFYQPENWVNLANVLLQREDRAEAIRAVQQGLELDPNFAPLVELHASLGMRRPPVLGFLERSNPVNRFLGLLRSTVRPPVKSPPPGDPAARQRGQAEV